MTDDADIDPRTMWDGGWEDAIESGHGLGDLTLDQPHPYDREDGYTPARRWGTRHELVSQPFADPADSESATPLLATEGAVRTLGRSTPTRSSRKPLAKKPQRGLPKAEARQ